MRGHLFERDHMANAGKMAGVGLGAAAIGAAAGAAVIYFLYGTETGRHRREMLKRFVAEMAAEGTSIGGGGVGSGELRNVSREIFHDLASLLKDKYGDLKNLSKEDMAMVADRIRSNWKETRDDIEETIDTAIEKRQ